jgi:hypothetical protein
MSEHDIQSAILLDLGQRAEVLIVRRNVGKYIAVAGNISLAVQVLRDRGVRASIVAIGTVGEADLQGIVGGQTCGTCGAAVHPRPFAIEVKSDVGRQRPEQSNWQRNVWERRGGTYTLARSVEDARAVLEDK